MKELNELMIDRLGVIYNASVLIDKFNEGKLLNFKLLINNNFTAEDIMKYIGHTLNGVEISIAPVKLSEKNIEIIEEEKRYALPGMYTEDLENPFFSEEVLRKLLEYRRHGLPIETLVNQFFTVEEIDKMLSYYIHTKVGEIYNEIKYMDRGCLDELLKRVDMGEEFVLEFLEEFRETRLMMIGKVEEYLRKYEKASERIPTHRDYVKVYTQNRYKKNN